MATLSQDALTKLKQKTANLFGTLLSDTLLNIYIQKYIETGNDSAEAIKAMRQTDEYKSVFAGNLNPDGVTVKYSEREYSQLIDGYKRKIDAIGINSDLIMTSERKQQLVENVVSPDELGTRINTVYSQVLQAIPQVKEFYKRNFNRDLTDEEIIASAIDPKIGESIISGTISARDVLGQRVLRSQIGAEALLAGTDITVEAAEALRAKGLNVETARRGFQKVRNIQQQALSQGRGVPTAQDIVAGLEIGEQEELDEIINIIRQTESQSSVISGATKSKTGAVTGLTEY
tara:strand:+ start:18209 stop:19075 length:867 start_codon:yes stop_codon:yes gene_type:complete